jgi:hypothetical protein
MKVESFCIVSANAAGVASNGRNAHLSTPAPARSTVEAPIQG